MKEVVPIVTGLPYPDEPMDIVGIGVVMDMGRAEVIIGIVVAIFAGRYCTDVAAEAGRVVPAPAVWKADAYTGDDPIIVDTS